MDGVSGAAVVIVAARVDGVPHRDVLIAALAAEAAPVALTVAHGLQHLAQRVARAAPTTEAAHPEAQVRAQAVQPARGKPPQIAPESHRTRQHGTPPLHAASNDRRRHKIGSKCGNSKRKTVV